MMINIKAILVILSIRKRWTLIGVILVAFILCLFGGRILGLLFHLVIQPEYRQKSLTIEQMAGVLNEPLPSDGLNLQSNGLTHGIPEELESILWFQMRFQASSESGLDFANHLCNNKLFKHFDPFDAIHVAKGNYKYGVIIKTTFLPYFAYSPSASDSIYGNRCPIEHGTVDVRVDNSLENTSTVELEYYSSKCPWPCLSTQLDLEPIPDFPLLVRGMESRNGNYFLSSKICLDINPLAYVENNDKWLSLLGSNVSISIDGKDIQPAYISENGNLLPVNNKEDTTTLHSKWYFNYCYSENWDKAEHVMIVKIKTTKDNILKYSLSFKTE